MFTPLGKYSKKCDRCKKWVEGGKVENQTYKPPHLGYHSSSLEKKDYSELVYWFIMYFGVVAITLFFLMGQSGYYTSEIDFFGNLCKAFVIMSMIIIFFHQLEEAKK